jgi:hypothetical protein
VEEKWLTISGVHQCSRFEEKRRRGSARFEGGKENVGWLLVPAWRGDQRLQGCGGDDWIDLRWKTTSQASWAKRLFGLDTVVEIKQAAEMESAGKEIFWTERKLWRRI